MKIEKLTPPTISSETILQEVVCTRPMREGKFNISVEKLFDKTIVHCYGHGGSGWTTLFGSIYKAIALFEASHSDKNRPIRIVGAGCMGLTAAIELHRRGYKIAGISTKSLYDMPSSRAAGYFALVSVKTSPEEQSNLNEIGLNTFLEYQKIERGAHPYITQDAVRFMPVYCSADTEAGVEDLEARGLIPQREYVTLDFGNGVTHPNFLKYMTYFMNTTTLMRQLSAEVERLQIDVELKEIINLSDIQEDVVFNCAGHGARQLLNDEKMIPVRGHLLTLSEASGSAHMDYMIYTKVLQETQEEYIYMFPKNISVTPENSEGVACCGVLGGTFIPHVDRLSLQEQQDLDRTEFQRMRDRTSEFFHGELFQIKK